VGRRAFHLPVRSSKLDFTLAGSMVLAIALWGGTNTGTKVMVAAWPPIWTGGSRFLCAGLMLLVLVRWTNWFGQPQPLTGGLKRSLWWRGGLSLAAYIVAFTWALMFTSVSHVALYLGAAPVWALFWERRPLKAWETLQRFGAAALALGGVFVLFWPALKASSKADWRGEVLGLASSILWANYSWQCRAFATRLSGAQVSGHTMWRAGVLLVPLAMLEVYRRGLVWRSDLVLIQLYCITIGGVAPFAIWSTALRHWPASQVLLFNNLVPLSTMTWAHFWLGEPVTTTFWTAMILIVTGVLLGQTNWTKVLGQRRANEG
jgi:drug/metabolite transporter (DMT)-like permease